MPRGPSPAAWGRCRRRRRTCSGVPEATDAAGIVDQLGDAIDLVLDGGPARGGLASTIVDCTGAQPAIVRVGAVPVETVAEILARAGIDLAEG